MHNKIRVRREEMRMTQEELAKVAGLSRPYLSTVETGVAVPTVSKAMAIAEALKTTVETLFGDKEEGEE